MAKCKDCGTIWLDVRDRVQQSACPTCALKRLHTALEQARREARTNDGVLFSELACNYVKQLADKCAEVERLKEETQLLSLVTAERDEAHAVIAEFDGGDNPDLWGMLVAERNAAKAEIKRLREVQLGDAAEFNRGCNAALAGESPVEPDDCPYDSWKCGYAWGYWMRHPELGQAAAEAAGEKP